MRVKDVLYMLGVRPRDRRYGYAVQRFDLPRDGAVEYAQWLHPKDKPKTIAQAEVDTLRGFLSPGDVAIDIGAHTGDSTLPIALAVGPKGAVFALEPNPYVYPVLEKNAGLNPGKTNIVPLNFAATSEEGNFVFEYSDAGYCNGGLHHEISKWKHGHAFKLDIEGRNLEDYMRREHPERLEALRFIKIDVEGYDLEVLKSIAGLIDARLPYLKIEVYKHSPGETRRELIRFLADRRYTVRRVESDAEYRGEIVTEDNVTAWQHYDIFAAPPSAA